MRPGNPVISARWFAFLRWTVAAAVLVFGIPLRAASTYEVTDLDPDPGFFSQAIAINNAGTVLVNGSAQMFLWSDDRFRQVTSGVDQSLLDSAFSLSAGGELTGNFNQTGVRGRPDAYFPLNSLIARFGATGAVANAIGPLGVAVGTSTGEFPIGGGVVLNVRRPVRWFGAKPEDLGTIGGREGIALAVNRSGQIAGWSTTGDESAGHATLWSDGTTARDLHTLGVLKGSQANAINDGGVVVGVLKGFSATQILPFVWIEGEGMRELPSTGYSRGTALGINNHNQIVGALDGSAILWEDGQLINLQNQIPAGVTWDLEAAYGINDAGWIVGYAKKGAVLLRPKGWDTNECPALSLEIEVLHPGGFLDGDDVTRTPPRLAVGGQPAAALAADGASRVLLRFTASKQNVLSVSLRAAEGAQGVTGEPLLDGFLSAPGGTEPRDRLNLTLQDVGGKPRAFAVYHAPQDFARPGTGDTNDTMRIIQLEVKFGDPKCDNASRALTLAIVRPPVIVMHGLWSSRQDAFGQFETGLAKIVPGIQVSGPDFANAAPLFANRRELLNHLRSVRETWRRRHIVATRADVFAHSMGGLLSRIWAQATPAEYLRPENHGLGDLHKLVTIDTPHYGGFPADILDIWEDECPEFTFALTEAMRLIGKRIDEGAIKDFRSYSQPIVDMNAGATAVPTHVIAGYFPAAKYTEEILNTLPLIKLLFEEVPVLRVFADFICDEEIHIPLPNDLIVSELSQLGGVKGDATDAYEHIHSGAAGQPSVVSRSFELLNATTASPAFAVGFPKRAPPFPEGGIPPADRGPHPARPRPHAPGDAILSIVEPAPAAFVESGRLIDFSVAAPADAAIQALLVMAPEFVDIRTNEPFSLKVRIATNAAGPVGIYAMAWDTLGRRLTNSVIVDAHPQTTLGHLVVNPPEFHFFDPGSRCQLGTSGIYGDGVARDLTLARTGTTYESSDPTVVTVTADGLLEPHHDGEATITVRSKFGGNVTVPVSVQLLRSADLQLSLEEAPKDVRAGLPARFRLRVKNLGPEAAGTVALRHTLVAGEHLFSEPVGSTRCEEADDQAKCYLDSLETGNDAAVEFTLLFDSPGEHRLVWSVNSDGEDPLPEDNHTEATVKVGVTPTLTATTRDGKFVLSWSDQLVGFRLEYSLILGPGNSWQELEGAVDVGDRLELGLDPSGAARYFRLHKP